MPSPDPYATIADIAAARRGGPVRNPGTVPVRPSCRSIAARNERVSTDTAKSDTFRTRASYTYGTGIIGRPLKPGGFRPSDI